MGDNTEVIRTTPRPSWVIGGALLIASPLIASATQPFGPLSIGAILGDVLFAAALVVFAIGRDTASSVTARRRLGTIALIALGVWTIVGSIVTSAVPDASATLTLGYINVLVLFVLAAISVVQIARAGTVPAPWNWVPTWVLAATVAVWVLEQVLVVVAGDAASTLAVGLVTLQSLVMLAGPVLLGVVAIVLGVSAGTRQPDPSA